MRLTLTALLCAALTASPALAHDHPGDSHSGHHGGPRADRPMMPPPGADMPPPPPGYGAPYGGAVDPRWERMHREWQDRCGDDRGDRDDRDDRGGCGHHGYPGAYPGAYMGYAVPMIMVPVLRSKPCPEVVEEWVEEVVPVRRRMIRPRARIMPDKRVPMNDKRVRVAPSKRIAY